MVHKMNFLKEKWDPISFMHEMFMTDYSRKIWHYKYCRNFDALWMNLELFAGPNCQGKELIFEKNYSLLGAADYIENEG